MRFSMTTEDKRFYRNVLRLVMPMALQNLINVGVTSTDVIMLGRVGETALSGVSLANQVYFILSLIFFGLTSGACVLTAQYWGKHDTRTIEKVMGMSFRIAILSAAVFTALALCVPDLGERQRGDPGLRNRSLCSGGGLCDERIYRGGGNGKTAGRRPEDFLGQKREYHLHDRSSGSGF